MLIKITILWLMLFSLFVTYNASSNERLKLASYYSLDGKELSFTKKQYEPYAVWMGDIAQEFTICSTVNVFCMWHIALPNEDLKNGMSWEANNGTYKAGNWHDFLFLGAKIRVIKIIPKNIEVEGEKYTPYHYYYSKEHGVIAIDVPFGDSRTGRSFYITHFLFGTKGIGYITR